MGFPEKMSKWLSVGKGGSEPVRASFITCLIGFAFVSIGDTDTRGIISMFFMVTYGAICLGFILSIWRDPSYRPTFKSHWATVC